LEPVEHHPALNASNGMNASMNSLEGLPPLPSPRSGSVLCEAVISPASPLIGTTVKDTDFRTRYQASIMAVHRSGEKLQQKIGQIELQAGDTLLIDAPENFAKRWRNSRDFILVSGLEDSAPVEHHRAWLALMIFAAVVLGMTVFTEKATLVALVGATITVFTGCLSAREAQRAIDLPVLLLIATALGVSKALDTSGAAEWIAGHLLSWAQPLGKVAVLATIVVLTGLLTELLSNNACAALMAVLALATAKQMAMDPRPLLIAVAATSSYGFATPIGYQTNLMVLGPGGYRLSDYVRIGIPLDVLCWTLTIICVATFWQL
jgi:di/tricarboxylate transporter